MDSGFNIKDSLFAFSEGEYIEIGSSLRFRYSQTRRHGELLFVKEPTEEYSEDLVTLEALRKEFLLGYGLNHPGIVRYYSLENNRLFEEYIEGKTLRQLLEEDDRRLYDKEFLRDITTQTLEALGYLHSKGIAHLDLKPENIMVSNLGNRVKIIDLSCAESVSGTSTPGFTKDYQAPEQISGKGNISSDIYQVGLILEEIIEINGKSRGWKKFISKSTANHPDNRFRNAEEALRAIPSFSKRNYKWISVLLLVFIAGGVISVVVSNPAVDKATDMETSPEQVLPAEEIVLPVETENADQPKHTTTAPASMHKPSVEDTERRLSKMIDQKLDELYAPTVIPLYKKMLEDYNNKYKYEFEFREEFNKAFKQLQVYGEELKKQYPDQASYIDEKVILTYQIKTGKMMDTIYPD